MPLDHTLDDHRGASDEEHTADRAKQLTLVQTTGETCSQQRSGNGSPGADSKQGPVDAVREVAEHAGHTEAEADHEVRPDGAKRVRPDETEQGTDPQGAEDQSDEAAEQSDRRAGEHGSRRTHAGIAGTSFGLAWPQEVDPEDEQRDPDRDQQGISRNHAGEQPPDCCGGDGWRSHPQEEAPVDPAGPSVGDRRSQGCERRDPDVCAGAGCGARGSENQDGEADVAQDETDEPARDRGDEAPESDCGKKQGVQALEYHS